jgi:hypothetical protein
MDALSFDELIAGCSATLTPSGGYEILVAPHKAWLREEMDI